MSVNPDEATTSRSSNFQLYKHQLVSIFWQQPEGCYNTPENSVNYRMNQTLTTPHCLWLGFISQHLHYDSELDSIADVIILSLYIFSVYHQD